MTGRVKYDLYELYELYCAHGHLAPEHLGYSKNGNAFNSKGAAKWVALGADIGHGICEVK